MKRPEVFPLTLDGMQVHCRSLPHNLLGFPNNLPVPIYTLGGESTVKALVNEDTCCGHNVADTNVSSFARARNICCGHKFCVRDTKNVSDFGQKHFVSATNVSQFAQSKKHHGQQCVRNNVSSFTRALRVKCFAQEHSTMFPTRARTQTARLGVERTNHEATVPPIW